MSDGHPRYEPRPLDTRGFELPSELEPLLESIAENVHEVWAAQRTTEGWSYGPQRDDLRKQSPMIVPYGRLPESEKAYDRQIATETLRFILARGYKIVGPPSHPSSARTDGATFDLVAIREELAAIPAPTLSRALEIWHTRAADEWVRLPDLFAQLADLLLSFGEPLLALDIVRQAQAELATAGRWQSHFLLRHLLGVALARSGATADANAQALELRRDLTSNASPYLTEETLGLVGRTFKDLALAEASPLRRQQNFAEAYSVYAEAAERTTRSYSAINAASMALLAGKADVVATHAQRARDLALVEIQTKGARDQHVYWQLATLGEAALLMGDDREAERRYADATAYARTRRLYGHLGSTRRQAKLVAAARGSDPAALDGLIRAPSVAVFTGHQIDDVDRPTPRFPAAIEAGVRDAISKWLDEHDVGFGFASAANGGDILFHEQVRARGGETYVVLPYNRDEFVQSSVRTSGSRDWEKRFSTVLQEATETLTASGQRSMASDVLLDYANSLLLGLALLRSRALETPMLALALWDGKALTEQEGTASAVAAWRNAGYEVSVIDIGALRAASGTA